MHRIFGFLPGLLGYCTGLELICHADIAGQILACQFKLLPDRRQLDQ